MSKSSKKLQTYGQIKSNYGPVETENERVGTMDAESPEAREDEHGLAALRARLKRRAR